MLLSARDQENRTVAGGVQNGKNQFPKTPGGPMKTPFAGKGDENATGLMPLGGKALFKGHADAFKTPMRTFISIWTRALAGHISIILTDTCDF